MILWRVGGWYTRTGGRARGRGRRRAPHRRAADPAQVVGALAVLLVLVFSKYFYLASLSTYYTFYLIEKFHVSVRSAQIHLFVFLGAVAAGTILGGPVGDRFGRKYVIWARSSACCRSRSLLPLRQPVLDRRAHAS